MKYNDYIKNLANKFKLRLDGISADFNFDYGDEFEIAICDILRSFLPSKYGICRGHIVNENGDKKGDDIIIYDQSKFPTLKLNKKDDYSRMENIPVEAVYAYIEAKHTLDQDTLIKAIKQIKEIKELCLQREKVEIGQLDNYLSSLITVNEADYKIDSYPNYRNPIFCLILSRNIYPSDEGEMKKILEEELSKSIKDNKVNIPDMVVAGNNLYSHIGIKLNKDDIEPTIFLVEHKDFVYYTLTVDNYAYGLCLANLFASLDWIRLGKMPWVKMLNEALEDHNKD